MRTARLGSLAEQDLVDIWQYTADQWTEEQADSYLDAIDRAIQQLVTHPEAGSKRDLVRDGYRVFFVNYHAIYYLITPAAIQVIRVLHHRMDSQRHM